MVGRSGEALGVDPRVRGGAEDHADRAGADDGRSPRARGSRDRADHVLSGRGSIPACAGEPWTRHATRRDTRVDPRVRGGASPEPPPPPPVTGRSPRARGSRLRPVLRDQRRRSIPACAGEPEPEDLGHDEVGVDPRVRGGASDGVLHANHYHGRSPRARGSHVPRDVPLHAQGSIPACAGEPRCAAPGPRRWRVDPRVRGGASVSPLESVVASGRSPRARGSLFHIWGSPGKEAATGV